MIWTDEELKERRQRIKAGGDRFSNDDLEVLFAAGCVCLLIVALGVALICSKL